MDTLEIPGSCSPRHERISTSSSASETVVDPEEYAEQESPKVLPRTIPPEHESRTLVLCFDGTGDQFDGDNSNIVQLCSLLKKDDPSQQMVYYQSGVGTYEPPKIPSLLTSKIYKTLDLLFACSLDAHVMDGYQFLMQNYRARDRICIFGFSRGAYTARSLAGMLHKVGLLPPDNRQQVPFAYKMYTRTDEIGWSQSLAFKEAFCIDVHIDFVGVWDTVDSVGLVPKRLPFTASNTIIRTFRHALSLDEHRAKFKANLWNVPNARDIKLSTPKSSPYNSRKNTVDSGSHKRRYMHGLESGIKWHSMVDKVMERMEELYSFPSTRQTDVEEVWFAGCHCDVGGGSVQNSTRFSLSRIPLRWMIRECFKAKTGIMFDSERLGRIGLDPASLYPVVEPRPPALSISSLVIPTGVQTRAPLSQRILSMFQHTQPQEPDDGQAFPPDEDLTEEEEELRDALCPIYDQLNIIKSWWILELVPLKFRQQLGNGEWMSWFGLNLGRPREIPNSSRNVKVHRSVRMRVEARHEHRYKPRAYFKNPIWIDDDVSSQDD